MGCGAGACPPNFRSAMEEEHCRMRGCEERFETLNYTEIRTWPKQEWEIVMGVKPCPTENMRFQRRIPVIADLLALPLARHAAPVARQARDGQGQAAAAHRRAGVGAGMSVPDPLLSAPCSCLRSLAPVPARWKGRW